MCLKQHNLVFPSLCVGTLAGCTLPVFAAAIQGWNFLETLQLWVAYGDVKLSKFVKRF